MKTYTGKSVNGILFDETGDAELFDEAGQIRVDYLNLSTTNFVDGVVKTLDVNSATPIVFSFPTTMYPHSTPKSYVGFFDATRGVTPTGRFIENPIYGQTHIWRFQVSYANKASGNNGSLDLIMINPVSGFQYVMSFTLPSGKTNGILNILGITIANEQSIPPPEGYILQVSTSFTDSNLMVNIDSITRISIAVEL